MSCLLQLSGCMSFPYEDVSGGRGVVRSLKIDEVATGDCLLMNADFAD